jgi:hypothetical protein
MSGYLLGLADFADEFTPGKGYGKQRTRCD